MQERVYFEWFRSIAGQLLQLLQVFFIVAF